MTAEDTSLRALLASMPREGRVTWIGVRPGRREPVQVIDAVEARAGKGLVGDRYAGGGKRQVTLLQAEHLPVVAALAGLPGVDPALLRRNVAVAGINVWALRAARFRVGDVLLEGTGPCAPCSHMERALGPGGFNAMRGHGGITARVLEGGVIRLDAAVRLVAAGPGDE
jgi:MOSC domain-containing protein YiiM